MTSSTAHPRSTGIQAPLGEKCLHLCIDMQRLFAEDTPWHTPWMSRVRPVVQRLTEAHPDRTIFTRFITPRRADEMGGSWRRYYERWDCMTQEKLAPGMLDLLPELQAFVPPATVFDKTTYSPFVDPALGEHLAEREADTLIISGAETDVCVLAAVMGAMDRGYRVVIPIDAICSSADETHDALLGLYHRRFGQQIETATTDEILQTWT